MDCCERNEKIRVFLEKLLIANLSDEILTNYTIIKKFGNTLEND